MRKYFILLIAAVALLSTSCTTVRSTSATASVETAVLQYPTVADLDISPTKVSRTTQWGIEIFCKVSEKVRKENLVAELLADAGADVLLEPQFIVKRSLLGTNSITVTGYPAKFRDFRKATEADLEALKAAYPTVHMVSDKPCHKHNGCHNGNEKCKDNKVKSFVKGIFH